MRRWLTPAIWIVVVGLAAGGGYYYLKKRNAADEEVSYRTAVVERRDVVVAVTAVGLLEPLTTVEVKANVAGEITELPVDRGDYVLAGDLVASIDPTETRAAYDQAEADVTAALAQIRERTAELHRQRTVTPAQVQVAADAVEAADARVAQAEDALEFQQRTTTADIARAEQALEAAKARLEQARARAKAQPDLTKASVAQAKAEVASAQQALKRLQEATHPQEKATAKAALDAAKVTLQNDRNALKRLDDLLDKGFVAKQEVEDAQTQLADSQDRHDAAKATYDSLTKRHAADIRESEARVDQAKAALASAETGEVEIAVSQRELEAAQAAVREAEASLDAARAGKTQDEQRRQELEAQKAAAQEARSQLRVAQAGELQPEVTTHQVAQAKAQAQRSQAQLENAAKNLTYTTIIAPRDGLVIDRYVEKGTVISSGRSNVGEGPSLVTIADVSRMFLLAEVDEADIGQVEVDQSVEIEIETFRDELFRGRVSQVYPKGEEIENVTIFRVRIEVLEGLERLRPGMSAEASIIIDRAENVLACPNEALFVQQGQTLAEVIDEPDAPPRLVEVEPGLASFEWTEVKSGLAEGEEVVVGSGGGGFAGMGGPGGKGGKGESQRQMRRMMRMTRGK